MRKQTKLVAVLSAAALLAIGASMTSFAATGWVEEDGTWVYYDKNGYKATDEWAKSGNSWFFLNSDGEMATETLIEDDDNYYFVDVNGAMVTNQWVSIENEDDGEEDAPDAYWYYFQANGKAYKAANSGKTGFKTINGKKYAFTDEGKMLYGWVDELSQRVTGDEAWREATYFMGDENDGAMATSWAQIDVIDTLNDDSEDQSYYFFFDTATGKKAAGTGDKVKEKTINGKKYVFDQYGAMQSEWTEIATPVVASAINTYKYYSSPEEGWRTKGWFKVVPQEEVNPADNADEATKWYYAESTGTLVKSKIKTINGKKYAFNDKGEMLNGVQVLKLNGTTIEGSYKLGDDDKITASKNPTTEFTLYNGTKVTYAAGHVYYFGDGEDGAMKTGNQNVVVDGETYSYSFDKSGSDKGQGLDAVTDGVLYRAGLRIKADADMRYEAFNKATGALVVGNSAIGNEAAVLVNTSGSVMKNKKNLKDTDDRYYCTDANGKVTGYSDKKCGTDNYSCSAHK